METRRIGSRNNLSEDFNPAYEGTPPWDVGRPQKEFVNLLEGGELRGNNVLDVGCGTGENALFLASKGFDVVGIDSAPLAIEKAKKKAIERGNQNAKFVVSNALELQVLGKQFDNAIDSGLFHVFTDEARPVFSRSLREVVHPAGKYFMLCFSEHEPGLYGPRRVTQREIRESFRDEWKIDYIRNAWFETLLETGRAHAWLSSITKM